MRRISERTTNSRQLVLLGTAMAAGLAAACGAPPTGPTSAAPVPIALATEVTGAHGTDQTWQDFQARGWNCRTPNNGPVTVCSPPHQPLPTIAIPPAQPPADRPEALLLKRWRNGVFEANVLLIRPEIYNGQSCESTGQPYSFIGILGYLECAHSVGG